jgi:hypothetical protein
MDRMIETLTFIRYSWSARSADCVESFPRVPSRRFRIGVWKTCGCWINLMPSRRVLCVCPMLLNGPIPIYDVLVGMRTCPYCQNLMVVPSFRFVRIDAGRFGWANSDKPNGIGRIGRIESAESIEMTDASIRMATADALGGKWWSKQLQRIYRCGAANWQTISFHRGLQTRPLPVRVTALAATSADGECQIAAALNHPYQPPNCLTSNLWSTIDEIDPECLRVIKVANNSFLRRNGVQGSGYREPREPATHPELQTDLALCSIDADEYWYFCFYE